LNFVAAAISPPDVRTAFFVDVSSLGVFSITGPRSLKKLPEKLLQQ
jgi:hypothetical protein